jgi:positive regulator of sigma E activity
MKMDELKEIKDDNSSKSVSSKKNANMLLGAFMIFIFPIITIFVGVFIGRYIGEVSKISIIASQIIGGVIGLVASAIAIKLFDKSSKAVKDSEKIYWDDL